MHLKDIVKVQNRNYYISTTCTFDKGWETMIFEADANNNLISWADLYCKRYNTFDEAREGHIYIRNHINEYITSKAYRNYKSPNLYEENKSCIKKLKDLSK